MARLVFILSIIMCWISSPAQILNYDKVDIKKEQIDSGEFKNYNKYDLGDFIFFNGFNQKTLRFKIQNKLTNKVIYSYEDSLSDAMILKPTFFKPGITKEPIFIMVEVAAEYSWGQEIIIIDKGHVFHPGYMNYAIDKENGISISDYCHISKEPKKFIMTFDNIPVVDWNKEKEFIDGIKLKFEISNKIIKRIE